MLGEEELEGSAEIVRKVSSCLAELGASFQSAEEGLS